LFDHLIPSLDLFFTAGFKPFPGAGHMFQNNVHFAAGKGVTLATVSELFINAASPDAADLAIVKTGVGTTSQAVYLLRLNIIFVYFTPFFSCNFTKLIIIIHSSFICRALVTHHAAISHHLIHFPASLKI
jgi:hypothetical protein